MIVLQYLNTEYIKYKKISAPFLTYSGALHFDNISIQAFPAFNIQALNKCKTTTKSEEII